MELKIRSTKSREVIDITDLVQESAGMAMTAVHIFVAHTTCAITTADLDPGTDQDLLDAAWEMIPKQRYRHPHNPAHALAHLASSIIGPSVVIPVRNGKTVLGTWQRVVLVELDGPRERTIFLTGFSL